jgi:transcriptional regulatory protein RtcR
MKSANKGVLFLDEIGELGLDEQAMCLRAIEEKRFLPVGADQDVMSDFQLLAGTNRDLSIGVKEGKFREDLSARLNLWTFQLPALRDRKEDIEPNLGFELRRFSERQGQNATFNKEARELYLKFAMAPDAMWRANFRDLSASVTRMAILAPLGRINEEAIRDEIERLTALWRAGDASDLEAILLDVLGSRPPKPDRHIRSGAACRCAGDLPRQQVHQRGRTEIVRGLAAAKDQAATMPTGCAKISRGSI